MEKTKTKETTAGSSSKVKLKQNKELLPIKINKPQENAPGPASGKIGPDSQVKSQEEIALVPGPTESSGLARTLFCGGFDFILARSHKAKLTVEEIASLSSPLDKIDIKLMGYLPEVIRKHAATASPVIELFMAANLIMLSRKTVIDTNKPQENAPGPASGKIGPDSQVKSQEEITAAPGPGAENLPDNLKPIKIEDQKPTP